MKKVFALFAALVALSIPLGIQAQELGTQTATPRHIDVLHLLAVGIEVDSDINIVAADRIVAGEIDNHRVGILKRETDEGMTRYVISNVQGNQEDGTISGTLNEMSNGVKSAIGSFVVGQEHVGRTTFVKGTITINGETTTFLGAMIHRAHTSAEVAHIVAQKRAEGDQGTDTELLAKKVLTPGQINGVRAKHFILNKCMETEENMVTCGREIEKNDISLVRGLEMIPAENLAQMQISQSRVENVKVNLPITVRNKIENLQQVNAFRIEATGQFIKPVRIKD